MNDLLRLWAAAIQNLPLELAEVRHKDGRTALALLMRDPRDPSRTQPIAMTPSSVRELQEWCNTWLPVDGSKLSENPHYDPHIEERYSK